LIYSKIIVPGSDIDTASNILRYNILTRLGILSDLVIAIFSILLAWSLYLLLKSINKSISLLALIFRIVDPIVVIITVSFSLVVLQLLNGNNYSVTFESNTLLSIVGLFFNLHTSTATIPMAFTSLGFLCFFMILIKTKIIPRVLTIFGIISYILVLISFIQKILGISESSSILGNIELIFYLPSVLFEIIVGFWLIIKKESIE
jgi:hypothetical protein